MGAKQRVYLDYNATAPVRPEVRRAVEPLLFGAPEQGAFGNPSSIHWAGQAARRALEGARARVARAFGRKPSEVIFTSGGSEADNLALLGTLLHPSRRAARLVVSRVEHPAVLEAAAHLAGRGVEVVRLPVSAHGVVDLDALERALEAPTALVSVMAVNNETGVRSPLAEIAAIARRRGVPVHTDAVQAMGRVELPAEVELVSFSGHKLGGLKGVGVLVRREEVPLQATLLGGPQERGLRAGTENAAAAVSLAVALELALAEREAEALRLGALRDRLERALGSIPGARVIGRGAPRVANTTTAVFGGVDGESVLQALDLEGVAASSGSACSSGSLEPSHVLLAMGVSPAEALSAVRFSLGLGTTAAEIDAVAALLPALVDRARASG